MNIYDIAQMAEVSIATVSRVMNGSDKVSEKTRKKVMEVIERVGFTPNVFAQGLGLNTMHTVGILVPTISDHYMSMAISYLEENLLRYGYDCLLGCSGFDRERKRLHVDMLLSKHVDALILVGSTYAGSGENIQETDYIREAARQVPVFIINGNVQGENIYTFVCDDKKVVYDVVTAMIKRGRRRILFLTDSHSYSARKKKEGYEAALLDAGLSVLEELELYVKNCVEHVRDILLQYRYPAFDAVMATDDKIAIGALKYAAVKGISVPEELSVVGYNNSVMAIICEPELTSVDNRTELICKDAVEQVAAVVGWKRGMGDFSQKEGACVKKDQKKGSEIEKKQEVKDMGHKVMIDCQLVKRKTTDF